MVRVDFIGFYCRALLEKANCDNEKLSIEIGELRKKKEELESRIEQQNSDVEEMKRLHQQTLAENAETIRSLKVSAKFSFLFSFCSPQQQQQFKLFFITQLVKTEHKKVTNIHTYNNVMQQ